jgi:hypothetical protein
VRLISLAKSAAPFSYCLSRELIVLDLEDSGSSDSSCSPSSSQV